MMPDDLEPMASQKVWVIFQRCRPLWITRLLHPDFRHCFVIGHDGQGWWCLEGRMNYLDVRLIRNYPADYDLLADIKRDPDTSHIVSARIHRGAAGLHLGAYSCLSITKRLLGLHKPFILTPRQLYKYLCADRTYTLKGHR